MFASNIPFIRKTSLIGNTTGLSFSISYYKQFVLTVCLVPWGFVHSFRKFHIIFLSPNGKCENVSFTCSRVKTENISDPISAKNGKLITLSMLDDPLGIQKDSFFKQDVSYIQNKIYFWACSILESIDILHRLLSPDLRHKCLKVQNLSKF